MASALRTFINFKPVGLLNSNVELKVFLPNTTCTHFVRWKRKPLWLGTAKTKIFRVPQRPVIPMEDRAELMRLFPRYKTQVRAIYALIKENMKEDQAMKQQALQFQSKEEEEQEWAECLAINDEWNADVAAHREQRLARELEAFEETALLMKIEKENKEKQVLAELEARVKEEKEKSKTYITPANIDEAIEKALDSVVDFNYAIDIQGNIYHGRATKPHLVKQESSATKSQITV